MIDCHCHIIPNIDDGATSLVNSLEMARVAVEEGIKVIIATPHHENPYFDTTLKQMLDGVEMLNSELELEGIPLKIKPGQEIRVFGELMEHLNSGQSIPLSGEGRYVLIEFPTNSVPAYTERLFYELAVQGYIPVIAHPERNKIFLNTPDKLFNLVQNGAVTQITTSSLTGHFGKKIKNFTEELIEANLTHLLASDAHNLHARTFRMKEALNLIEKKYGKDLATDFRDNGNRLLLNKDLISSPPEHVSKKKFFTFFS